MLVYPIDEYAKQKAVESGKVKGTTENGSVKFTDTPENLARFVKEAGDSLWDTKRLGQLERVNLGEKP